MSQTNRPKANRLTTFVSELRQELQQVTWPTRAQTIKLTVVVIVVCFVIGLYLGGLDYLFTRLMGFILNSN